MRPRVVLPFFYNYEVTRLGWTSMKTEEQKKIEIDVKPSEVFTPLKQAKKRKGLKIAIAGREGSGKTHFGCTCPEPIYFIDTEFGVEQVARKFDKDIHIVEAVYIDPKTDKPDPIKSLDMIERAIKSVRKLTEGTIVLDTITAVWSWIGDWLKVMYDAEVKQKKFYQFMWGPANRLYDSIMVRLLSRPMTAVFTGQKRNVWIGKDRQPNLWEPSWQKTTAYWSDVFIDINSTLKADGSYIHTANIPKFRFKQLNSAMLEPITYQALVKKLAEEGVRW